MIQLPVVERLKVDNYPMFPGTDARPGINIALKPGLTLVLGANGLGKTTLVTLLYRILTGPTDIPTLGIIGGPLGGRSLETRRLSNPDRRMFGNRVVGNAADARATLGFRLGDQQLSVTRDLDTLSLRSFVIDGEEQSTTQDDYEAQIARLANSSSFSDWILALRHLTFYFEDRRALVWDPTAQRQLLRLLFLSPEQSEDWKRQERAILELDSLVRNLQYSLTKEERLVAKSERAVGTADEVRQQLRLLQAAQAEQQAELDAYEDELAAVAAARQTARVNALSSEQAHESAVRSVERLQLRAIGAAFPTAGVTAQYIVGQLLADDHCLTCGNIVPEFTELLQKRLHDERCPVCDSPSATSVSHARKISRGLSKAREATEAAEAQRKSAASAREDAEGVYDELLNRVSGLTQVTSVRSAQIADLIRRLPPDEQDVQEHRSQLAVLRSRLEQRKEELRSLRTAFDAYMQRASLQIANQIEAIKSAFDSYATGFLVEDCELRWAPTKDRLGETGSLIEFPAFQLDMTGANFTSPVRRSGPEQVSESQREFIDLSYRMALMQVAGPNGGTLVIDAPESSLDAVFVTRAADVLTSFSAAHAENRLLITSNLVDGNLIPELISRGGISSSRDPRVLDLLRVAAPTAATKQLGADYAAVRRSLFARAKDL